MPSTLFVDDEQGLLDTVAEVLDMNDAAMVFLPTLAAARVAAKQRRFDRIIADFRFEGETDNGASFLEEMRDADSDVDLVLLTAREITDDIRERMAAIGARILDKNWLDTAMLRQIFSDPALPQPSSVAVAGDPLEMRLRYDQLLRRKEETDDLNRLLVRDILKQLEQQTGSSSGALIWEGRTYSPDELRDEVVRLTPLGKELIRWHHKLFEILISGSGSD